MGHLTTKEAPMEDIEQVCPKFKALMRQMEQALYR